MPYDFRWTFDNTGVEEIGSGLDLVLQGNAAYSSTKTAVGSHALFLDGSGDQADPANTDGSDLELAFTERTVSLWLHTAATNGLQLLYEEGGATNGIAPRLNGSDLEAAVQNGHDIDLVSPTGVGANSWHHAVVVFAGGGSSGEVRVYLDAGAPTTSPTAFGTVNNHSSDPAFGGNDGSNAFDSGDDEFSGYLDDIRVWNRALSDSEVETLFDAQAPDVIN